MGKLEEIHCFFHLPVRQKQINMTFFSLATSSHSMGYCVSTGMHTTLMSNQILKPRYQSCSSNQLHCVTTGTEIQVVCNEVHRHIYVPNNQTYIKSVAGCKRAS